MKIFLFINLTLFGQVQCEIAPAAKYGTFARAEDLEFHIFQGFRERPFGRDTKFNSFLTNYLSGSDGDSEGSHLSFQSSVLSADY